MGIKTEYMYHVDIRWKFTDRFLEMVGWDEVLARV